MQGIKKSQVAGSRLPIITMMKGCLLGAKASAGTYTDLFPCAAAALHHFVPAEEPIAGI